MFSKVVFLSTIVRITVASLLLFCFQLCKSTLRLKITLVISSVLNADAIVLFSDREQLRNFMLRRSSTPPSCLLACLNASLNLAGKSNM